MVKLTFPPLDFAPRAILFTCTMNSIRSPMAEAILKKEIGTAVFVDSVGIKPGVLDPFMVEVLAEIGINRINHRPKLFADLFDDNFDLIIALSPESFHHAIEMTRVMACAPIHWRIFDPSITEGSREERLNSYRMVRDTIHDNIKQLIEFYQL